MSDTVKDIAGKFAQGIVTQVFGNLIYVEFEGDIRQGEVAFIKFDEIQLKAEVIEVFNNQAKLQVFEDTKGIEFGTKVEFCFHLLEAELGPGLL